MCSLLFSKLNNVVEQHSYSADDDPTTVTEPLLSQKYIESNDNTHENSLPPPEIISLSYGEYHKLQYAIQMYVWLYVECTYIGKY